MLTIPTNQVHESWYPTLHNITSEEFLEYSSEIWSRSNVTYPATKDVLNVFRMPLQEIRLVIFCDTPFAFPYLCQGLGFYTSTKEIPVPLQNFYKILKEGQETVLGCHSWEEQGIFLLSSSLTASQDAEIFTHCSLWENFIKSVIKYISVFNPCTWLFLGNFKNYRNSIANPLNLNQYLEVEDMQQIPKDDIINYVFTSKNPTYKNFIPYRGIELLKYTIKTKTKTIINF